MKDKTFIATVHLTYGDLDTIVSALDGFAYAGKRNAALSEHFRQLMRGLLKSEKRKKAK